MTITITQAWIDTARTHVYHRTPARRIDTIEQAEAFIDEVGFAFLWPIKGVEAPSLFEAIAGGIREVPNAHDDPDLSRSWDWKDRSLGSQRWYYAKILRRRATLIAPRLWATFYALTKNYGDLHDYMEQVIDGVMTHEARSIYEALLESGPLNTIDLRSKASLAANSNKSRFERGLVALQVDMKALPVGVAEAGAWRYSFIYDIPMRHYRDLPLQAREIGTRQAWQTLIGQYVQNAIAVTTQQVRQLFHVFEPTAHELEVALAALVDQDVIVQAQVEGGGRVWVAARALEAG
ncbi:MAG: hypothetical protein JW910_14145 [Anaerolineae bacterium]|nr:hypothetical protein [Anaerolineae bacterium]